MKICVSHCAAHKLTLQFAMSAKALPLPSLRPPPHKSHAANEENLSVHSRSPADSLLLNFAKRSDANAHTNTVENLTDTPPVVR